jgi:para-nitrobenzyl esterase
MIFALNWKPGRICPGQRHSLQLIGRTMTDTFICDAISIPIGNFNQALSPSDADGQLDHPRTHRNSGVTTSGPLLGTSGTHHSVDGRETPCGRQSPLEINHSGQSSPSQIFCSRPSKRWMRRTFPVWICALFALAGVENAMAQDVEARTQDGVVVGTRSGDITVFKGIPFAQPPIGNLRWKPPLPPLAWKGTRPAKEFASACMQTPNLFMNVPSQPVSEDCLYLNVWSPAQAVGEHLPVLVWIHGGGFSYGSTAMPLFDGEALARKGVVMVSVAYRVGPLGFFAHPELSAESPDHVSGNYGLLDQIASLQWVHANIAAFGGDPARVTIMGESAGSISVSMLIQSPLARGLFSGAIGESGGAFGPGGMPALPLAQAEAQGSAFGESVHAQSLSALRAMPADELIKATPQGSSPFTLANGWPVLDGHVLPSDPMKLYREKRFNDTPILMGNNDDEGALFPGPRTREAYIDQVNRQFGAAAQHILEAFPARTDQEAAASAIALMGDATFGANHYAWARLQARYGQGKVFYYHFAHLPPSLPGFPSGATHGAELPYVFNNLGARDLAWTQADHDMAELLSTYWTNFAKHGDPNGPGLPSWTAFSSDDQQVNWLHDGRASMGPVPHADRLHLLDAINSEGRDLR